MKNIRDKINVNFVRDDVVEITWNPTAYHLDTNKGEKIFHKTIMAVDEVILRVCLKVIVNLKKNR
jgi:hypothetical protein